MDRRRRHPPASPSEKADQAVGPPAGMTDPPALKKVFPGKAESGRGTVTPAAGGPGAAASAAVPYGHHFGRHKTGPWDVSFPTPITVCFFGKAFFIVPVSLPPEGSRRSSGGCYPADRRRRSRRKPLIGIENKDPGLAAPVYGKLFLGAESPPPRFLIDFAAEVPGDAHRVVPAARIHDNDLGGKGNTAQTAGQVILLVLGDNGHGKGRLSILRRHNSNPSHPHGLPRTPCRSFKSIGP